ncbi:unnamed protein product [Rhodiola kirilowii]
MSENKSWMLLKNRACQEYRQGVEQFLNFAYSQPCSPDNKIKCPCTKCNNGRRKVRDKVRQHLIMNGIVKSYTIWNCHGESSNFQMSGNVEIGGSKNIDEDDMIGLLMDTHGMMFDEDLHEDNCMENQYEDANDEARKFYELLHDAEDELYPGCTTFSKLSFIVTLLHLKVSNHWSNKSFTMLLKIVKRAFPFVSSLPDSYYECRSVIRSFGLHYEKIDACINDCILYRKQYANEVECPVCKAPRWKTTMIDKKKKCISQKILRYFPLTPRLQRLYMSVKTADSMRWHHEERVDDGVLRHPADSEVWKAFDRIHGSFATESRNVRLGLASDGFSPFGNMNNPYSVWPVVLTPYNLPPWLCMKEPSIFLTVLIPGPTAPGNDIDVYLQPLIDELRDLWENGVETYDASKKQNFQMHAALLWTINDFPAYGNLSGWGTKGKMACPSCHVCTSSLRLKEAKKTCYMGHRRFLPMGHRWRGKKMIAPRPLSGDEVLNQLNKLGQVTFGKASKSCLQGYLKDHNWRKCSIFFELPYWRTLLLRHNLDVMHVEKNICDNVLGTILQIAGKSKDSKEVRLDLETLGIRRDLWLKIVGGATIIPDANYLLRASKKKIFFDWMKELRFLDSYSSNIAKCVKNGKLMGMKTHDYHVLLEQVLPLALPDLLPKQVADTVVQLAKFFRDLCCKTMRLNDLSQLEEDIVIVLCKLERIFLPSFFDVMEHLAVHLAGEAKLAGPVQYRWMYPIERYLRKLKSYVSNKAKPEGSIAEGYIAEECLTFCSRYLTGVETHFNREERNSDGHVAEQIGRLSIFEIHGRPLGASNARVLTEEELDMAHFYVLENCDELIPYVNEHKTSLEASHQNCNLENVHRKKFSTWIRKQVEEMSNSGALVDESILSLARGPDNRARYFTGYFVNGFRFHTRKREKLRKNQNCGVLVRGDPKNCDVTYFGQLVDIIELRYLGENRVVLFKCDWYDVFDNRRGVKTTNHGYTLVNTKRRLQMNAPYVMACQAEQVFYVHKIGDPHWQYAIQNKPRNFYDVSKSDEQHHSDLEEPFQMDKQEATRQSLIENAEDMEVDDLPGEFIDINSTFISDDEDTDGEASDRYTSSDDYDEN